MSALRAKRIETDVLAILSALVVQDDKVTIPMQLDRKMYERVNEVLEALGGKWNRKAKAHVFGCDPAERIDSAIVSGTFDKPADHGFFPTPASLADDLAEQAGIKDGDVVLEPSAGHGALVDAVLRRAPKAHVVCVELLPANLHVLREKYSANERVRIIEGDLLALPNPSLLLPWDWEPTCALMNPPFARQQDIEHMRSVWDVWLPQRLVSVASAGVLFRDDKRAKQWRSRILSIGGTIEPLPEGSFRESGTDVNTCVVSMTRES